MSQRRYKYINGIQTAGTSDIVTSQRSFGRLSEIYDVVSTYAGLIKLRLTMSAMAPIVAGFYLATQNVIIFENLIWTVIGTFTAAAGASAFNQWFERDTDKLMDRTKNRAIPSGKVSAVNALRIASILLFAGLLVLVFKANVLTSALTLAAAVVYVVIYTPLKLKTPLCTFVGAICGFILPLIGWSAASGVLSYEAFGLAALLFIWQIPHFLSLAYVYRKDYERAGIFMIPSIDSSGNTTSRIILSFSYFLLLCQLCMHSIHSYGQIFLVSSSVLGIILIVLAHQFHISKTPKSARKIFFTSVLYLPIILSLLLVNSI